MITLPLLLLFYGSRTVKGDEYTELVKSEVGVKILPLTMEINSTEIDYDGNNCTLTAHRGTCGNRALREHEKISWSTRVCFLWKCDIEEHAMRVGACWIGSKKNPVTVIKPDGCTQESAIIRSPSYHSKSRAMSIGWLSVRELGMTHVYVHCRVHLCHLCDENCRKTTPPNKCRDVTPPSRDQNRVWNNTVIDEFCNPPTLPPVEVTSPAFPSSFSLISSLFLVLFILRV